MLKVLINSYTCCPGMGSEPGMGWNWIISLAHYCEIFVITEGEFRPQIESWLNDPANETVAKNLHFYWNPVSDAVRKMCWNQGDWRFYKYYKDWQKSTADIARKICSEQKIDILHQLNMIGFREPGYLWKVSQETGIPFVWGPVDAKESFPMAYAKHANTKTKCFMAVKNFITGLQLRWSSRVRKAANQASFVVSASSNSVRSFAKFLKIDSPLLNETGSISSNSFNAIDRTERKETLDILWVGKFDFRKQLDLAIKSVARSGIKNIILHILGGGDSSAYKKVAEEEGVSRNCIWHGIVSHDEVQKIMQQCDLMLFTSVAEGTPHVVLEAIANGLPVLCFDTCGQGDCVSDSVGIKIPLTTPEQSAIDFAEAIKKLNVNRDLLKEMSENCAKRAQELSWENKAKAMLQLYEKAFSQQ